MLLSFKPTALRAKHACIIVICACVCEAAGYGQQQLKVSELALVAEQLHIDQSEIDACFDADNPRGQFLELIDRRAKATAIPISSATSNPSTGSSQKGRVSQNFCGAGEVETMVGRCERVSRIGRIIGSLFTYSEEVPMLLREFTPELKSIMIWLRHYILEREAEWVALPARTTLTGRTDTNDRTLSARSTRYSLLSSGRNAQERERLRLLTDFIAGALIDFQTAWQDISHPANTANPKAYAAWGGKKLVTAGPWASVQGLWVESWANVHRSNSRPGQENWANYSEHHPYTPSMR